MPLLRWNVIDLIDYLNALPEIDEYDTKHSFIVENDYVRLCIEIWQYESIISLTLYNKPTNTLLTTLILAVRGEIALDYINKIRVIQINKCIVLPSRFFFADFRNDPFIGDTCIYATTFYISLSDNIYFGVKRP